MVPTWKNPSATSECMACESNGELRTLSEEVLLVK